jgi:putative ABC transport system permease protein
MINHYLRVLIRNFRRQKSYSLINLSSFVIGLSCAILVFLFVRYEFSYDRYHENSGRIYRVLREHQGDAAWSNSSEHPLAAALQAEFPEVVKATRLKKNDEVGVVEHGDKRFYEEAIFFADQDFLGIFSFPLVSGDASTALREPFSVLLTRPMAEKYFGAEDPVGKSLRIQEWYSRKKYDYQVKGVLRDIPKNSHFHFDFLISYNTMYSLKSGGIKSVESWAYYEPKTYVELSSGADARKLESKFPAFLRKHKGEEAASERIHLQPLTRIHLGGNMRFEIEPNSDMRLISMISAIALCILVIASLNYTNLSVAQTAKRAVEVGMRKVVGADRPQLFGQFLGESVAFAVLAYGLSLLVVDLVLPAFNSLIERDVSLDLAANAGWLAACFGIAVLVGVLSGSYPAFLVSAFEPLQIIKRTSRVGSKRSAVFRNSLVVSQFVVAIGLLVCTFVIHDQLTYIRNKDLGFGRDEVLTIFTMDAALKSNPEPFKRELLKNPHILGVTASLDLPTTIRRSTTVGWDDKGQQRESGMNFTYIDDDFLDVYGIPLEKGRNFSSAFPTDKNEAIILNATAAKELGWDDPIGKKAVAVGREWTIVGVMKDFNFQSLHWKIDPLVCVLNEGRGMDYFSIKVRLDGIPGTLAFIEKKWKEFSPEFPFHFAFLDERIDTLYKTEQRLGRSVNIFASLALVIACSGLFGLVSFLVEQKRREIAIRRVLGADFRTIICLLTREYAKCLGLAAVIAWPIGYFAMRSWLRNFAYRTSLTVPMFLGAALAAFAIAATVVSLQTYRAAAANPIESIRYE